MKNNYYIFILLLFAGVPNTVVAMTGGTVDSGADWTFAEAQARWEQGLGGELQEYRKARKRVLEVALGLHEPASRDAARNYLMHKSAGGDPLRFELESVIQNLDIVSGSGGSGAEQRHIVDNAVRLLHDLFPELFNLEFLSNNNISARIALTRGGASNFAEAANILAVANAGMARGGNHHHSLVDRLSLLYSGLSREPADIAALFNPRRQAEELIAQAAIGLDDEKTPAELEAAVAPLQDQFMALPGAAQARHTPQSVVVNEIARRALGGRGKQGREARLFINQKMADPNRLRWGQAVGDLVPSDDVKRSLWGLTDLQETHDFVNTIAQRSGADLSRQLADYQEGMRNMRAEESAAFYEDGELSSWQRAKRGIAPYAHRFGKARWGLAGLTGLILFFYNRVQRRYDEELGAQQAQSGILKDLAVAAFPKLSPDLTEEDLESFLKKQRLLPDEVMTELVLYRMAKQKATDTGVTLGRWHKALVGSGLLTAGSFVASRVTS